MSEKIIEFENVTYIYETEDEDAPVAGFPALTDVNLTINKGEFVAVLGHNGSGKSTLAKLCNAILEPTKGTVTVKGIVPDTEEKADEVRRIVGMVSRIPIIRLLQRLLRMTLPSAPKISE